MTTARPHRTPRRYRASDCSGCASGSPPSAVTCGPLRAAGAAGFLVKDILPEDFLHAVRVAARGDALLAPSITRKLINRYVAQPLNTCTDTGLKQLTNREREAVALVAQGLSNDEIADRMVI